MVITIEPPGTLRDNLVLLTVVNFTPQLSDCLVEYFYIFPIVFFRMKMLLIYLILSSFALALTKAEQKMKGKKIYFHQNNQCLGTSTYDLNF